MLVNHSSAFRWRLVRWQRASSCCLQGAGHNSAIDVSIFFFSVGKTFTDVLQTLWRSSIGLICETVVRPLPPPLPPGPLEEDVSSGAVVCCRGRGLWHLLAKCGYPDSTLSSLPPRGNKHLLKISLYFYRQFLLQVSGPKMKVRHLHIVFKSFDLKM